MKKSIPLSITLIIIMSLSGCMGRNAISRSIQEFNLETAEDPWGRQGMFLITWPVVFVTNFMDLFVVNSIEFWSGSNPISHQQSLTSIPYNSKGDDLMNMSASTVQPDFKELNVISLEKMGITRVLSAQVRYLENEVLMYVSYQDGSREVFHAIRDNGVCSFYRGKELVLKISTENLQDLHAMLTFRIKYMVQISDHTQRG